MQSDKAQTQGQNEVTGRCFPLLLSLAQEHAGGARRTTTGYRWISFDRPRTKTIRTVGLKIQRRKSWSEWPNRAPPLDCDPSAAILRELLKLRTAQTIRAARWGSNGRREQPLDNDLTAHDERARTSPSGAARRLSQDKRLGPESDSDPMNSEVWLGF